VSEAERNPQLQLMLVGCVSLHSPYDLLERVFNVIARHEVPKQSLKGMVRLLCGACPERHETLRGVYPERDSSVASLSQNDKRRRACHDR